MTDAIIAKLGEIDGLLRQIHKPESYQDIELVYRCDGRGTLYILLVSKHGEPYRQQMLGILWTPHEEIDDAIQMAIDNYRQVVRNMDK